MSPSHETYLLSAETDDERKDWIRVIKQFLYSVCGGGESLCCFLHDTICVGCLSKVTGYVNRDRQFDRPIGRLEFQSVTW